MKMIYVGTLSTAPDRDSGWIRAFSEIGIKVIPHSSLPQCQLSGPAERICRRFSIGRGYRSIESKLIKLVEREKPDWVHFRLPIEFSRRSILELKKTGTIVTEYFNDDPFSKKAPFGLYWKFRHALSAYDAHFVYRGSNIEDFSKAGAKYVQHCPPTYDPYRHHLADRLPDGGFLADAAFIGHWEDDWREDCLAALVKEGFKVVIRGGGWNNAISNPLIKGLGPITHAFGKEYNYIYANAVAGLCFFSKINNDEWTERALEIVAVGGLLVCERTVEAESYFNDREEACFFSSIEELIKIVKELKQNPRRREEIRTAGYNRLLSGHHTVLDRARKIVRFVTALRSGTF